MFYIASCHLQFNLYIISRIVNLVMAMSIRNVAVSKQEGSVFSLFFHHSVYSTCLLTGLMMSQIFDLVMK